MTGTNLQGANLTNTNMSYVTLGNAQAQGTNFTGSQGWTVMKFTGGNRWNSATTCPNGASGSNSVGGLCKTQTLGY